MNTAIALVEHRARGLAKEYSSKGYAVVERPSQAQLPDFLAGYYPDFLLRKIDAATDDAVVAVVRPRSSLAGEPQIWELPSGFGLNLGGGSSWPWWIPESKSKRPAMRSAVSPVKTTPAF